jgi:GTP cyclohydrolase I
MAGNARSPPDNSSLLADLSLNDSKLPTRPNAARSPLNEARSAQYPRQQREGYGFRPRSGHSTPLEEGGQGPFSPILKPVAQATRARTREDEEEDDDERYGYHQPDRISVGELRQGVKEGLQRRDEGEGEGSMVVKTPGIADADGLGWPGMSCTHAHMDLELGLTNSQIHF